MDDFLGLEGVLLGEILPATLLSNSLFPLPFSNNTSIELSNSNQESTYKDILTQLDYLDQISPLEKADEPYLDNPLNYPFININSFKSFSNPNINNNIPDFSSSEEDNLAVNIKAANNLPNTVPETSNIEFENNLINSNQIINQSVEVKALENVDTNQLVFEKNLLNESSNDESGDFQGKFGDFDGGDDVPFYVKDQEGNILESFSLTGAGVASVYKNNEYLYIEFLGADETTSVEILAINNIKFDNYFGSSLEIQTEGSITAEDITLQNTSSSDSAGLILKSGLGEGTNSTASGYTITDIGVPEGKESEFSTVFPFDINNYGEIVGYAQSDFWGAYHAFLYKDGEMIDLGTPSKYQYSEAYGINDNTQVVGYGNGSSFLGRIILYSEDQTTDEDLFTEATEDLFTEATEDNWGYATAINDNGQIVGYGNGNNVLLYSDGFTTDLSSLLGDYPQVLDINNSGQIVGSFSTITGGGYKDHSYIYKDGQITVLQDIFGVNYNRATAINDNGQVVGVFSNNSGYREHEAFLYDNNQITNIGILPGGNFTYPYDINDSGQIVGFSGKYGEAPYRAFLYKDGEIVDLNSLIPSNSGVILQDARAINDKGQIVSYGKVNNKIRTFLLNPINFTATPEDGITVGNISTLGDSIELQGLKLTLTGESINTNGGDITFDAPTLLKSLTNEITFDSTVNSDGSGGGDITFKNAIDGYIPNTQTINFKAGQEGNITFEKIVGSSATLSDFIIDGALTFTANEDITTDGNITLKVIDDIHTANLTTNELSTINISLGKIDEEKYHSQGNVTTGSITAKELEVLSEGGFTALDSIETQDGDVNISSLKDINITQITTKNGDLNLITGTGGITATDSLNSDYSFSALARQDITTNTIDSNQYLLLKTMEGNITVNETISSNSSIALTASKNIVTQNISSLDGTIDLVSANGTVTANGGISSLDDVYIGADLDIVAQSISSRYNTVALGSNLGSININGYISGANVSILGKQNVSTGAISSWADVANVISEQGLVTTGSIATDGGDIYLASLGNLTSQNIYSNGGAINIISSQGSLITGYIRSDVNLEYPTVGIKSKQTSQIKLQAASQIKVVGSVLINDTEYSIYTGSDKKNLISIYYESDLRFGQKSNFTIKDASFNGTIGEVSNPVKNSRKPLISFLSGESSNDLFWIPATFVIEGIILLQEFFKILPTAPAWQSEVNPLTNLPYSNSQEHELVRRFSGNQRQIIRHIINNYLTYEATMEDILNRGQFSRDETGCFGFSLSEHLGRNINAHHEYATWVSGSQGDFVVIPVNRIAVDQFNSHGFAIYDGLVLANGRATQPRFANPVQSVGALSEVKTGHGLYNRIASGNPLPERPNPANPNGPTIPADMELYENDIRQFQREASIAEACHKNFFISFDLVQVAANARPLINAHFTTNPIDVLYIRPPVIRNRIMGVAELR